MSALVLLVVGTDHHPFDRVVRWVDAWAANNADAAEVVVQHGSAHPPRHARGSALVPYDELAALMRRADVVITHGGPATITEVRSAGLLPVTVPRDPALGEHVDDHQQLFSRRMGAQGLVLLCETESALGRALDAALTDPSTVRLQPGSDQDRVEHSVARVAEVLRPIAARGRRSRRR